MSLSYHYLHCKMLPIWWITIGCIRRDLNTRAQAQVLHVQCEATLTSIQSSYFWHSFVLVRLRIGFFFVIVSNVATWVQLPGLNIYAPLKWKGHDWHIKCQYTKSIFILFLCVFLQGTNYQKPGKIKMGDIIHGDYCSNKQASNHEIIGGKKINLRLNWEKKKSLIN